MLVPPSCALAQALLLDPTWQAGFSDYKAIVLLRTHPAAEKPAIFQKPIVRQAKR